MTTKDKIARRKLSLLELAREVSKVSRACKVMGYSRQQFYEKESGATSRPMGPMG